MLLVFYCNYLNHHQVYLADAFYEVLGNNFYFVATLSRNEKELKGGEDYSMRPYCILAAEFNDAHKKALSLAQEADVCIFGACSQEYAVIRAKNSPHKLSFECGERWLKRGLLNILSPVFCQWWLHYMRYYRKANFFKLCSSAFSANDDRKLGCYDKRHFKWGYFTNVPMSYSTSHINSCDKEQIVNIIDVAKIIWCGRFIDWKHPEIAIKCASMLKEAGYLFQLNMYGDGAMRKNMEIYVEKLHLEKYVNFYGSVSNEKIQHAMRKSDICILTSDRQEGWGAVANEAMANGCCLVCSDEVGSAPFLIKNYKNGLMFKCKSIKDLFDKVSYLIRNPYERKRMSEYGHKSMFTIWSPKVASERLLILVDCLQNRNPTPFTDGPCSIV